jgi:hypothetical protein
MWILKRKAVNIKVHWMILYYYYSCPKVPHVLFLSTKKCIIGTRFFRPRSVCPTATINLIENTQGDTADVYDTIHYRSVPFRTRLRGLSKFMDWSPHRHLPSTQCLPNRNHQFNPKHPGRRCGCEWQNTLPQRAFQDTTAWTLKIHGLISPLPLSRTRSGFPAWEK